MFVNREGSGLVFETLLDNCKAFTGIKVNPLSSNYKGWLN
jgi:hypothetical protein